MPEMDGYEVCTRLKADPITRDIPVIFLTAMTEAKDETRGFDVGAVDYIHKPFSPAVVMARVQTHLNLRETREQLAREKRLVDRLLDNILPAAAVTELKATGRVLRRDSKTLRCSSWIWSASLRSVISTRRKRSWAVLAIFSSCLKSARIGTVSRKSKLLEMHSWRRQDC